MFAYRIISDGPHRAGPVYIVVDEALYASGQLSFDERPLGLVSQGAVTLPEMPPLRFVFEETRRPGEG